jgi:hypothetical protein
MPTLDDHLRDRIGSAAPAAGPPPSIQELGYLVHRRVRRRRISAIAVVAAIAVATVVAFSVAGDIPSNVTPGADDSPSPPVENLGLSYAICRVSTMPIAVEGGTGAAAVFTRASDGGCPTRGDGFTGVGIDIDDDGVYDATSGPIADCWYRCEVFAAPDINHDGVSEVTVSTEGADGYGIFVFAVETSPASIDPVMRGTKPFEFPWADVATHASSADCVLVDAAFPAMHIYSIDKVPPMAHVEKRTVVIDHTNAVPEGTLSFTTKLADAPTPGTELCGSPIYGSARRVASTGPVAEPLAGVPFPVCGQESISGNFGVYDTAWLFQQERMPGVRCSSHEGFPRIGIGASDTVAAYSRQFRDYQDGTRASLWATPDINADDVDEIAVATGNEGGSQQFVLFTVDGGSVVEVHTCDGCSSTFDWGGPGGHLEGAYCETGSLWAWNVELDHDRYRGWLVEYTLEGARLVEASRQQIDVPVNDRSRLPDGGGSSICGSPVRR